MARAYKYLNLNSKVGEVIFDEKTKNEIKKNYLQRKSIDVFLMSFSDNSETRDKASYFISIRTLISLYIR